MASPELSARLRYLNDSAYLLATTAPETSRHLMSRCNALKFDNQIEDGDPLKRGACGACGTLIVPGWEGRLESHIERSRVEKKGMEKERRAQKREMVYECGTCGKKTRESVKSPPPVKRGVSVSKPAEKSKMSGNSTLPIPSTSSSSKKRAKSRKGGLAAILAQKKTADTSGNGFDLMNFMKKV